MVRPMYGDLPWGSWWPVMGQQPNQSWVATLLWFRTIIACPQAIPKTAFSVLYTVMPKPRWLKQNTEQSNANRWACLSTKRAWNATVCFNQYHIRQNHNESSANYVHVSLKNIDLYSVNLSRMSSTLIQKRNAACIYLIIIRSYIHLGIRGTFTSVLNVRLRHE